MRTSFLDYYKLILEKVSFDEEIFNKEYEKASESLSPDEKAELNKWLKKKNLLFEDTDVTLRF